MRKIIYPAFIVWLLISTSGCEKRSCCGYPTYHYNCSNGSSGVSFTVTGPGSTIQGRLNDSLNFYQDKGYTCSVTGPPYISVCVFGAAQIRKAIKEGDICVDPTGAGSCGPEPGTSCE